MRGRAIRVNDNPNKTANIWHLVCTTDTSTDESLSNADFEMLKRRFKAFVGLNYNGNYITNGISRLGGIYEPFTDEVITNINEKMKNKAINRTEMLNSWRTALVRNTSTNEMSNKIVANEIPKMKKTWFINKKLVIIAIIFFIILFLAIFNIIKVPFIVKSFEIGLGIYLGAKLFKMYKFSKSENMIKEVGYVILNSLYRCKFIKTSRNKVKLQIKKSDKGKVECYISGAAQSESNLFVDCLDEVFSKTINQRYIISK